MSEVFIIAKIIEGIHKVVYKFVKKSNAPTIDDIHKAVDSLAKRINAHEDLLPTYGYSIDFGHPHIEVNARGLHWVVIERGKEWERKTTEDHHELLYWIFESVTFSMATKFEVKNRIEGQDCRRIIFQKQGELLGTLDSSWKKRNEEDYSRILGQHPYDDNASLRADLYQDLLAKGYSAEEADKLCVERYPLPLAPKPNRQG